MATRWVAYFRLSQESFWRIRTRPRIWTCAIRICQIELAKILQVRDRKFGAVALCEATGQVGNNRVAIMCADVSLLQGLHNFTADQPVGAHHIDIDSAAHAVATGVNNPDDTTEQFCGCAI